MPWGNALEELMRYIRGTTASEPLAGQAPIWDYDNPMGTETLQTARSPSTSPMARYVDPYTGQYTPAGMAAVNPLATRTWGDVARDVIPNIKRGAQAVGDMLSADVMTPMADALSHPGVTLPEGGKWIVTDSGDAVQMPDGRVIWPSQLDRRAAVLPVETSAQWPYRSSVAMPGLPDVLPAFVPGGAGEEGAALGANRVLGRRRISAGYETIDPAAPAVADDASAAFGIGHNNPPVRSAIWAAPQTRGAATSSIGRMGSNADATLEGLGLPAYADIVPSANTGPVPQEMLKSGSPVRPGQVFDLSDTWQVPNVPQEDLPRIDPNEGRRRGLPPHIIAATTDPEMRAKLRTVAEAGLKAGGAFWYNAEPLRLAFVTELGPEEGNAVFSQYMRTIGAVSAGSDVGQNIRTASYYNIRERQGNPVQGELTPKGQWAPTDIESPYGHKMQNTQYGAYRDIAGGNPLDPAMRPKRASFDANLGGNQQPVTVDKHNMRLIGMLSQDPEFLNGAQVADVNYPSIGVKEGDKINWKDAYKSGRVTMDQLLDIPQAWKDVPEANHYAALEGFQQDLAREMGISPAQLQAALWVGGGRVTGLRSLPTSFMGALENRLQRTAAARGGTPTKALLDFIRGKKPLLTPLAATAGAGAANALAGGEGQ